MTGTRPYRGQPPSERKSARRAALVEAGLQLLGSADTPAISVRAVCREAGLSSRYFYESFANLDELLTATYDQVAVGTMEQLAGALRVTDGTVGGLIEALATIFLELTLDDPRATRIGFVEAWNSEALVRRRLQSLHTCAHALATEIANLPGHHNLDRAATEVAAFILVGGLIETILGWLDGALTVDRDTLVRLFTASAIAAIQQVPRTA